MSSEKLRAYWVEYAKKWPDRVSARSRVSAAVAAGRIPRVSTLPCVDCGDPAEEYDHHRGYSAEFALDVQPVCKPCHGARGAVRGERKRQTRRNLIAERMRSRRFIERRMGLQLGLGWSLAFDAIWCDEGVTRRLRPVDDFGNPDPAVSAPAPEVA